MSNKALFFIMLFLTPMLLHAQTGREIRGTVTDEKGQPIAGVTVNVKGSTTAVATGMDGNFIINAREGSTLVFTGVSVQTKEVPVTSETFYPVTLIQLASTLGDVVVVGMAEIPKELFRAPLLPLSRRTLTVVPSAMLASYYKVRLPGLT